MGGEWSSRLARRAPTRSIGPSSGSVDTADRSKFVQLSFWVHSSSVALATPISSQQWPLAALPCIRDPIVQLRRSCRLMHDAPAPLQLTMQPASSGRSSHVLPSSLGKAEVLIELSMPMSWSVLSRLKGRRSTEMAFVVFHRVDYAWPHSLLL